MSNLLHFIDIPDLWVLIAGIVGGFLLGSAVWFVLREISIFMQRHWKVLLVGCAIVGAVGFWL